MIANPPSFRISARDSSSETLLSDSETDVGKKSYNASDYCEHCQENELKNRSSVSETNTINLGKEDDDAKDFRKSASFPLAQAIVSKEKRKEEGKLDVCVELKKEIKRKKKVKSRASLICTVNCKFDIVRAIASKFGMRDVKSTDDWDIYWTDYNVVGERVKDMKKYQKINHFPGMSEICRKDLLARNLNRMYKLFPGEYNIFPTTWCLPSDIVELTSYSKAHPGKTYIVKPDTGCRGCGIFLTKRIASIKSFDKMICQLYIAKPLLIDNLKFDLRVYTLITSCDPLRIYVYNEGLARFATSIYCEPSDSNTKNTYMHLTNYSVNKHSRFYIADTEIGSKRRLSTLNQAFEKNSFDVKKIWRKIDEVIVKTIIAAYPSLKHTYRTCFANHESIPACFEILGFDIMLDHKMTPFVLEVNHSPSYHTERPIDREVKEALLTDTFRILNLAKSNKKRVADEEKKRISEQAANSLDGNKAQEPSGYNKHCIAQREAYKEQVRWEEENMGNYRLVYPADDSYRYEPFFNQDEKATQRDEVSSFFRSNLKESGEKEKADRENEKINKALLKKFEQRKTEVDRRERDRVKEREDKDRKKLAAQKVELELKMENALIKKDGALVKNEATVKKEMKYSELKKDSSRLERNTFQNVAQRQSRLEHLPPSQSFAQEHAKLVPRLTVGQEQIERTHHNIFQEHAKVERIYQNINLEHVRLERDHHSIVHDRTKVERAHNNLSPERAKLERIHHNASQGQPKHERTSPRKNQNLPLSPPSPLRSPKSSHSNAKYSDKLSPQRAKKANESNESDTGKVRSPTKMKNAAVPEKEPVGRETEKSVNYGRIKTHKHSASKGVTTHSLQSLSPLDKYLFMNSERRKTGSTDQKRARERPSVNSIAVEQSSSEQRTSPTKSVPFRPSVTVQSIPGKPEEGSSAHNYKQDLYKLLLQIGADRRLDKLIKSTKIYEPYAEKPNIKEIFD